MRTRFLQTLSLVLAALLQIAPLVRTLLPAQSGLAPSAWAIVLKIGVGAIALLGFDAVSQASSISISPANATVGTPYTGTITYSGGHAGAVNSMTYSNNCLSGSPIAFLDGMTITYSSGNTATVSGTPTNAANYAFTLKVWSGSGCGGSHSDTRSTTLVVGSASGGAVAPSITASPQNTIAQVGTTVQLSGGASGNPIPQYQWWQNAVAIPGATNSVYTLPNVQLSNAGIYTMTASNSQNVGGSFGTLPKANCYLSVCITPGTNFSVLDYTNFIPAGAPLTMSVQLTNTPSSSNFFTWFANAGSTIISTSNTLNFTATQLTPNKGGTYTCRFDSTNSGGYIVTNQSYDSYWAFGYPPNFTNSLPASTNVSSGANVTFNVGVQGSLNVLYIPTAYNTNLTTPNAFWYQNNTLVASQVLVLGPTSGTTFSNSAAMASLTLNNVTSANSGNYTLVITNFWGSLTSSPVALTVPAAGFAPGFSAQPPAALSLLAGQSGSISVTATGTPPLVYLWRKNGTSLANGGVYSGVTTNALNLASVVTTNAGNYTVAVTNSLGATTSSVSVLSISLPPSVSASASGGNLVLNGSTVTGLTYVVESTTNLAGTSWSPILTNSTSTGGTISFSTNSGAGINFYRIKFP
jgi:Immunoglobulin domain/Immunoglobulin I-set domain